jgi:thiol-disulfide isomerase/thioredoxin
LKKYPCKKTNDSYLLSDDQILAISVLPNNEFNGIKIEETSHLKNSNIMTKNKNELFNIFKSIEKTNQLSFCKFCNKEYKLNLDLKKHLVLDCFYNDLNKNENNHKFTNIGINNTMYNNSEIINSSYNN